MTTQKRQIDRLILVFDADSGAWDAFVDSAKKVLRIRGCALCQITHGLVTEKGSWRSCQAELGVPVEYVHRDEVSGDLAQVVGNDLPCIVAETGDDRVVLLGPEAISRCRGSVSDLRGKLHFHASKNDLSLFE